MTVLLTDATAFPLSNQIQSSHPIQTARSMITNLDITAVGMDFVLTLVSTLPLTAAPYSPQTTQPRKPLPVAQHPRNPRRNHRSRTNRQRNTTPPPSIATLATSSVLTHSQSTSHLANPNDRHRPTAPAIRECTTVRWRTYACSSVGQSATTSGVSDVGERAIGSFEDAVVEGCEVLWVCFDECVGLVEMDGS